MTRREAILTALAATVCGAIAGQSEEAGPQLLRWDSARGAYVPIGWDEVRKGDAIWFKNEPAKNWPQVPTHVYLAHADSQPDDSGSWGFDTHFGMSESGEWVSLLDIAKEDIRIAGLRPAEPKK